MAVGVLHRSGVEGRLGPGLCLEHGQCLRFFILSEGERFGAH